MKQATSNLKILTNLFLTKGEDFLLAKQMIKLNIGETENQFETSVQDHQERISTILIFHKIAA